MIDHRQMAEPGGGLEWVAVNDIKHGQSASVEQEQTGAETDAELMQFPEAQSNQANEERPAVVNKIGKCHMSFEEQAGGKLVRQGKSAQD